MIETDMISEVMLDGGSPSGLRIGGVVYNIWHTNGVRSKCRVDDLVFKFDSGESGQSWNEAVLSTQIQLPDRKYFVEVIHTGVAKDSRGRAWRWAAQPYIEVVACPVRPDQATIDRCQKIVNELIERYRMDDLGGFTHNWTVLNGEPLIYDYGFSSITDRVYKRT